MDLTGRFPCNSSRGNEYILITYHINENTTVDIPLKNRPVQTIKKLRVIYITDSLGLPQPQTSGYMTMKLYQTFNMP